MTNTHYLLTVTLIYPRGFKHSLHPGDSILSQEQKHRHQLCSQCPCLGQSKATPAAPQLRQFSAHVLALQKEIPSFLFRATRSASNGLQGLRLICAALCQPHTGCDSP